VVIIPKFYLKKLNSVTGNLGIYLMVVSETFREPCQLCNGYETIYSVLRADAVKHF